MENKPKIGIVTVLYNSGTVVEEFFETLNQQTYTNFVLYVINNASPDDSLAKSQQMAQKVSFKSVVLDERENWGVAKGNNLGIEAALTDGCDMVLLSNNDTVLEPTTIENLLTGLQQSGADMAVPKIYFWGTHLLWACGAKISYFSARTPHYGYKKEDKGQFEKEFYVNYSPTCFMLIRKEVFAGVGMMDEKYFVYWDDTDFVIRAIKKGVKLIYIPTSHLWHKESTSTEGARSDFSIRYYHRNLVYIANKYFSPFRRFCVMQYAKLRLLMLHLLNKITKHQYKLALNSIKEGKQITVE